MKLSWSSIGCLFFTVIAIGRGWHLHKQSTKDLYEANTKDLWYTKHDMLKDEHLPRNPPPNTLWGSKANNIFYFVQLSDLHISKYRGKGHTIHFLHFLQSLLPTIKPEFVVVTGDLVDAKDISHTISEQVKEEWQVYKSAVVESKGETPWYDMRGNHDCFDMASWESSNNLYKDYGMSSASLVDGKGVYKWVISKEYGNYSFVAADSCPKKGPARPFNFFGYLTTNAMDRLVDEIIPFSYNHTFLFSHYPTTTLVPGISSDGYTFNDLSKHISAYFCGHLHRLVLGLGDHLKSYNAQSDSLELEVSDMKDHGSYRIVAIDHDLVSFVDIDLPIHEIPEVDQRDLVPLYENNTIKWPHQLDSPPVILITNPKDTKFALPTKEPLQRIGKSTHIRFLIFSKYKPEDLKVEILIDNYRHPFAAEFVGDISQENYLPLWVSAWDPNDFNDLETHTVQVNVHALNNKIGSSSILFRTDDIRTKIQGGIGEWLIESSISLMVQNLALFALLAMMFSLLIPKVYNDYEAGMTDSRYTLRKKLLLQIHKIQLDPHCSFFSSFKRFAFIWLHRLFQFSENQPYVWYTCYIFLLCTLSLPWFKAQFIPSGVNTNEQYGHFYIWGLLFHLNEWVPLSDTWMYALFKLTFDIAIFILFFIWKSSDVNLLYCKGSESGVKACTDGLVCDRLWFLCILLVYWAGRIAELIDLSMIYGGIWPTFIFNILSWWLMLVLIYMVTGHNGLMARLTKNKYRHLDSSDTVLLACPICKSVIMNTYDTAGDDIRDIETSIDNRIPGEDLSRLNESDSSIGSQTSAALLFKRVPRKD